MNRCFLIGNLTKDPELRKTANDNAVCTFTVAVARAFSQNEADFIPVVAWRTLAENCGKYLSKGKKVAVCGRVQIRSYEAKDGNKRYVTEVVADEVEFLSPVTQLSEVEGHADAEGLLNSDFEPLEDGQLPF